MVDLTLGKLTVSEIDYSLIQQILRWCWTGPTSRFKKSDSADEQTVWIGGFGSEIQISNVFEVKQVFWKPRFNDSQKGNEENKFVDINEIIFWFLGGFL